MNVEDAAKQAAESIAREMLSIPTLEQRGRDEKDFHELGVWGLREALITAYRAGYLYAGIESKTRAKEPVDELIEAVEQLGFLNSVPSTQEEKNEQLNRIHQWYIHHLRPALARVKDSNQQQ